MRFCTAGRGASSKRRRRSVTPSPASIVSVSGGEDGSIVAGPFETTPPRLDGGEKEPRRMVLGGASPGCHRGRLNTVGCTPDVAVAAFGHRKRELVSRKKKRVTRKRNGFFLVSSIRGF